jgi:hypothetical protein
MLFWFWLGENNSRLVVTHPSAPGPIRSTTRIKPMSDNYTPEQITEMEREASHIAYAISTAIVNSKFSDQERDLVKQMVLEAAQQLAIKMALILPPQDERPRFNISAYIKTSNMGQRKLELNQEETVG